MQFDWDDECIFFKIERPTESDLDKCDIHELNSPLPLSTLTRRLPDPMRHDKFKSIPMAELCKRFACLPEKVIKHSLDSTTQFCLEVMDETRQNPQKHFRNRFPGLPSRQQHEVVATDHIHFSHKSSDGHIGGQFFHGVTSKRWEFFPLRRENHNVQALQDYIRKAGPPLAIKSDNAKSEIGQAWTSVLRNCVVNTKTTEPHHPHQNPA